MDRGTKIDASVSQPSHGAGEYVRALMQSERMGDQVKAYRRISGCSARLVDIPDHVPSAVRGLLNQTGIRGLYSHQVESIDAIHRGRHTVIATPTASGKSLIYNLSFFQRADINPLTRALYLFPLKALAQDQLKTFLQWAALWRSAKIEAVVYDGDTTAYQRKKIRQNPPSVVMTNPEMVHLALLPHHGKWNDFFSNLETVVIDEVHTYRGLLGSHISQLLRRLQRVCKYYNSTPTFIFSSATVANPAALAGQLSGLSVATVDQNGAPQGPRHVVFLDPAEGPARTAILLLKAAMARRLRTIVYTQSRKLAELVVIWCRESAGTLTDKIGVYRAGLLPEERRQIEMDLKEGKLLAVVSTSALELGIDIGDLDLCVLLGYPGSMIAAQQRAGRVGRKGQESAVIFVAGQDALDQYYLQHPEAFFSGRTEAAVVNPYNTVILNEHLVCAAAELPLNRTERWMSEQVVQQSVSHLVLSGRLKADADGDMFYAHQRRPHHNVNLRTAGMRYCILDRNQVIGEIDAHRRFRETHGGAVYLHNGISYIVGGVDEATHTVSVKSADVDYYTRVRNDTDVLITDIQREKYIGTSKCSYGTIKVTDQVTGYETISTLNGRCLGLTDLDVPPVTFETQGLWFELSPAIGSDLQNRKFDLLGALHAAEHALIGIMPLLVLADRNDIGGLATPVHPQTSGPTIFIYDGMPGGAGLSRQAFDTEIQLLKTARNAIDRCGCIDGCPACVHSPKCGSGNHPMDKRGGSALLHQISGNAHAGTEVIIREEERTHHVVSHPKSSPSLRYGVFDLETQLSAAEVGGWHMAHRMKVSCGVIYDAKDDSYTAYTEDRMPNLIRHLQDLDLVIGFNSKRFDYKVLSGYSGYDFKRLPSLDLLEMIYGILGFRLSLDHLAVHRRSTVKKPVPDWTHCDGGGKGILKK